MKFAVCSDLHVGNLSERDEARWLKNYKDEIARGEIDSLFCCGDVIYGNAGLYQSPPNVQQRVSDARYIIADIANNMSGLICSGNHECGNNYGPAMTVDGTEYKNIGIWNYVSGYSGYTGVHNGTQFHDSQINVIEKNRIVFVSVSSNGGGTAEATTSPAITKYDPTANFPDDTVTHTEWIIDDAISLGKRVIVFIHYPYSLTLTNGTWEPTNPNDAVSGYQFGLRCTIPTTGGGFSVNSVRPDGTGNSMFQMLAGKRCLVFSGHCHNPWEISHPGGCVLRNGSDTYTADFPHAHEAKLSSGCMLVNLPAMIVTAQDAKVYVYDDHVEIRERASLNSSGAWSHKNTAGEIVKTSLNVSNYNQAEMTDSAGDYYSHIWEVGEGPVKYTATFVADGDVVDTVEFEAGASVLPRVPAVPAKEGYTGAWKPYTLSDADITINAVYTAVEPEPPSGGVLSVHIRLTRGGTITRYEELPSWVRERLERVPERPEDKEKLWYMENGKKNEITWG